ncbi:Stonustoxin subunit beta [Labeo rohita]|uniref:Stonustoxin subunit beta n=1 Tax=Labeo rohita TaxID=84645 RepID=A0ABQ8L3C5_LABRO|nr:Stonustoxin subunit beta [Labeo rohita]
MQYSRRRQRERRQTYTSAVDHGGESRITTGLKKWVCFLTLDPNTANKHLFLSEGNRKVINVDKNQSYPDHPDRFDHVFNPQVLCRESVCGRCYWEIECSGHVYISVSYKSISRKGRADECRFGCNDQSWSLFCSRSRYSFRHNKIVTDLPVKSISRRIGVYDDNISRIGVYVDVSAGTLSFYSVSDTMSLIHTVQTTFTQPLYPGFGFNFLDFGSSCRGTGLTLTLPLSPENNGEYTMSLSPYHYTLTLVPLPGLHLPSCITLIASIHVTNQQLYKNPGLSPCKPRSILSPLRITFATDRPSPVSRTSIVHRLR